MLLSNESKAPRDSSVFLLDTFFFFVFEGFHKMLLIWGLRLLCVAIERAE